MDGNVVISPIQDNVYPLWINCHILCQRHPILPDSFTIQGQNCGWISERHNHFPGRTRRQYPYVTILTGLTFPLDFKNAIF